MKIEEKVLSVSDLLSQTLIWQKIKVAIQAGSVLILIDYFYNREQLCYHLWGHVYWMHINKLLIYSMLKGPKGITVNIQSADS